MGGLLCRASSPEPLVQAAKTALWVQLFAELACAVLAVVWCARWPNRRERGGLAQAAASLVASTTAFSVAVCGRSLSAARPRGARPAAACAALAVVTGSVAAAALREARAGQGDRATGTLLRIALLLQLGLLLARATCCDILAKLDDPPERVFSDFAAVEVAPRRVQPAPAPPRRTAKPPPREATEECVICLQRVSGAAARLPCAHVFHAACIEEWLRTSRGAAKCPICRTAVSSDDSPSGSAG